MRAFTVTAAQLETCPLRRLTPAHWRADGTCRCNGSDEPLPFHAAARYLVRLDDGRIGRLVYAPGRKALREGRTDCRVYVAGRHITVDRSTVHVLPVDTDTEDPKP